MELWYSEFHTGNVKLSVRINRQLFSGESEFQRIDVFESEEFGRFVALDGEIVFSDKDEFIYDEMVTHVPMTVHPNVKNVLIIGGGDGGVARELIHYPQIESIDVVESDKMFVDVCAEMFPDIAQGLKDERVNIYYEDGLDLFAGKNDHEAVRRAGESGHKEINRTNLSASDIREALKKDVVAKQLELLRMRNTHKAFEKGAVITVAEEGPKLSIRYDNGEAYALLTVDFEAGAYEIELS